MKTVTAVAHPNIAFIKYWGNRNQRLRLPVNGSISMNLAGLITRTQVSFDPDLPADTLSLNGRPAAEAARLRVSALLNRVRALSGLAHFARVESHNNFPTGAGIASSASAFAALSLAATAAAGLALSEADLSRLARTGSGSACRSAPGGFVEWRTGSDCDSYAFSIAPPEHWALADCVAIVSHGHKPTGSSEGHVLAHTSPLQKARVADTPRRLELCRRAILEKDFEHFAAIVEQDCNLMHAVMISSSPPLLYWQPGTLAVLHAVEAWRREGLPACYTIDAGPNVHVLCPAGHAAEVERRLSMLEGVEAVMMSLPGGAAKLL